MNPRQISENTAIGALYNKYLERGLEVIKTPSGHELITPDDNLQVLSDHGEYKRVKCLSRHKTSKSLVEITCSNGRSVTVTTDHICMTYNDDHMFENTAAKDLKPGAFVKCYDEFSGEFGGHIVSVSELGPAEDYVYDLEVEDNSHVFYANDILIHNSLFVNIQCFTDDMKAKNPALPKQLMKWDDDSKLKLWKTVEEFIDNDVVPFVQNLIREKCHTNHPEMLRYGVEYIADTAFYEKPKHYAVHKMIEEGPELVDGVKFMGIELKKATQPVKVKEFLAEIYTKTMIDETWSEAKFKALITDCYNRFRKLGIEDIASWKGYKSARESDGFLEMVLGATGISKGCTYYNQMLDKLGIGKKYDKINLGDKVRFTYINPNNRYKINCMAFPASTGWPEEFNGIFAADYNKMFEGVMSALKSYMNAIGFRKIDPRKTDLQNLDDL